MLLLSILLPYLCNGIFISKERSKKNVAHGNWMHKTFCYFTVFVYRQNKWSRILGPVRGGILSQQLLVVAILRVNLGTVSLLDHSVIHLSVTYFCWANHYLLVGCLWIHPQNDMKAITLHKIRDISPKNRSDMSLEIAFLSLASCLILYAFHSSVAVRIGKEAAAFCIWLCVTFRWSTVLLSTEFWHTGCCCWKDKRSSWNLSLWCWLLSTTLAF